MIKADFFREKYRTENLKSLRIKPHTLEDEEYVYKHYKELIFENMPTIDIIIVQSINGRSKVMIRGLFVWRNDSIYSTVIEWEPMDKSQLPYGIAK